MLKLLSFVVIISIPSKYDLGVNLTPSYPNRVRHVAVVVDRVLLLLASLRNPKFWPLRSSWNEGHLTGG